MRLTADWLNANWPEIVRHTGLDSRRIQLVVVGEMRPDGAAEAAYWAPSFHGPLDRNGVYAVVRRIGDLSEAPHHLVVVWQELPGLDEASVTAILRHEVEHAAQWERYGPPLFDDLDWEVRRAGELAGRDYSERPTERAANDAARALVHERYGQPGVQSASQALAFDLAEEGARNLDVRAETDAILRAWSPPGHTIQLRSGAAGNVEEFLAEVGDSAPLQPNAHGEDAILFL